MNINLALVWADGFQFPVLRQAFNVSGKFRTTKQHNVTKRKMTFVNKFLLTFLTAITLTVLFACGQGNSNKNGTQANSLTTQNHALTIDTFSIFPPEINGCSCYFSNNLKEFKKDEYISQAMTSILLS